VSLCLDCTGRPNLPDNGSSRRSKQEKIRLRGSGVRPSPSRHTFDRNQLSISPSHNKPSVQSLAKMRAGIQFILLALPEDPYIYHLGEGQSRPLHRSPSSRFSVQLHPELTIQPTAHSHPSHSFFSVEHNQNPKDACGSRAIPSERVCRSPRELCMLYVGTFGREL